MKHWNGKRFFNPWPHSEPHGFAGVLRWSIERFGRKREVPLPPPAFERAEPVSLSVSAEGLEVTWIGHSTFLIQLGELNFLTDPIWSQRASPFQFMGPKRISQPGLAFQSLPPIHAILLSHDHYDHLDRRTVAVISVTYPDAVWFVPKGVGRWLAARGVQNFTECDWDENRTFNESTLTCVPAQHFSGRTLMGRDSTLWCGWVVRKEERSVLFAGDTGLHPEFKRIAADYGPFSAAILPIGAYDPRWFMRPVHMDPDDAVAAYRDLANVHADNRCVFIPSHWGTFLLTDEPSTEPPEQLYNAWQRAGLSSQDCVVLRPGETFRYHP